MTPIDAREPAAVLERQRAAFLRDGPPSVVQRRDHLAKLKAAVLARREELAHAVNADFGKRSRYETALLELVPIAHGIEYLRRRLARWMRPERRRVAVHFAFAKARVYYQPLGVVGIVTPWNYPLSLALMPLATALAAGNRVMLKPSEFAPATNAVLAGLLGETFSEERVALVPGDARVGAAFAALPFDHLLFTGSTNVGQAVMRAASEHLVPVTLELGGKSPAIVERGFPAERAAASIAFGKLANAGQTCIAPDYALVHEGDVDAFAAAYAAAVQRYYPAGTADDAYASIATDRQFERLTELIEDARAKGARVVEIDAPGGASAARVRTIPPTLVFEPTPEMAIGRSEIFGPILPVVTYREIDEAIAHVNARPRPLALYLFARDRDVRDRVLRSTTSGNVTVNDTLLHFAIDDLPFGGVGPSGIGAYHGREGFKRLSHAKGVFEQSRWTLSGMMRAPFGRRTDALLRLLLR